MNPQTHRQELVTEAAASDSRTTFGFWVYIMTDCILFASLFATYAVLQGNVNGGEAASELFSLPNVLAETLILLASSFSCGIALLAAKAGHTRQVLGWLAVTFLLGLSFLFIEVSEFRQLVIEGNSWRRSGFLSSFFTLVGTHGLHITAGLLWLSVLMTRIWRTGFGRITLRRLTLFSLFWHFLDLVWIFIFTVVYLGGAWGV
jgi:cytochrome o ubiquinol oxidase subunit 3